MTDVRPLQRGEVAAGAIGFNARKHEKRLQQMSGDDTSQPPNRRSRIALLLQAESRPLFHFFRGRTRNVQEIEDLVQETFERAWRGQDQPIEDDTRWLWGIANNVAHEHWNKRVKASVTSPDDSAYFDLGSLGGLTPPELVASSDWERRNVARALKDSRLKNREIAVLIQVDVYGLSYAESAQRCRLTVNQVKKILSKARARLRDRINRLERDIR